MRRLKVQTGKTTGWVLASQKKYKLTADGIAGAKTLVKLDTVVK